MRLLYISITIFFIFVAFSNSNAITFQTTKIQNLNPEFVESMFSSPLPESTPSSAESTQFKNEDSSEYRSTTINEQTYLNYQPDQFPIVVNKYVLSSFIDRNYKNKIVKIAVQCTNIGNKPLKDVKIFEIINPGEVSVINCSSPVKASSIDEILRYERKEANLFCERDIINPKELAESLKRNKLIADYLENHNITILNNSTNCDKTNLSKILNKIITDLELYNDTNKNLLFDVNSPSPSKQTRSFLKHLENSELQESDRKLLNHLLLKDKYSRYLPTWENIDVKDISIDEATGIIDIPILNMRPRDTLIFKYYVNLSNYGVHRTTTIIRLSENKYPDLRNHIYIPFPAPKFNVRVILPDQEVSPKDPVYLNYIVDLLVPTNESAEYEFEASVENNNQDFSIISDKYKLIFKFKNKTTSCNSTNITFNEPGLHNIPVLIMGDSEYLVQDKYIKVEELWSKYILVLTLMFLGFCTVVGGSFEYIIQDEKCKIIFSFIALLEIALALQLIEVPFNDIITIIFLGFLVVLYWKNKYIESLLGRDPKIG